MYQYNATALKIIDGDTIDLDISLGFMAYVKVRCRLAHIDTPELRSPIATERDRAKQAAALLTELLADPKVVIRSLKPFEGDKYGRWLVEIVNSSGAYVNQALVDAGLAVDYSGGTKTVATA